MNLFRNEPETDVELDSRVDRLQSECRQARLHCESLPDGADKRHRLMELEAVEQDLAEAQGDGQKTTRTRIALRAEAELCLTKPLPMLVSTANRLRDKLYRLYDGHRRAWERELDRLIRNGVVHDEAALRLQLQTLTYELTAAAARYRRLAKVRAQTLRRVLLASLVILIMLLAGLVASFDGLMLGVSERMNARQDGAGDVTVLSCARLMPVLLAGGLGAMISIVPSTIGEKGKRPAYFGTYPRVHDRASVSRGRLCAYRLQCYACACAAAHDPDRARDGGAVPGRPRLRGRFFGPALRSSAGQFHHRR